MTASAANLTLHLVEQHRGGMTRHQLAAAHGLTYYSVGRRLRRYQRRTGCVLRRDNRKTHVDWCCAGCGERRSVTLYRAAKMAPRCNRCSHIGKIWCDPAAVEALRRGWDAGDPVSAIATVCRTTRGAVIGKAWRLGLGRHPGASGDAAVVAPPRLTEDDFRGCRYIIGEPVPLRPGMHCGAPVEPGRSYCAAHLIRTTVRAAIPLESPHVGG